MSWAEIPFEQLLADSKDGEWGQGGPNVGLEQCLVIRGTDYAELDNPTKDFPTRWIKSKIIERKRLYPGDILLETAGGTSTQSTGRTAYLKASFFREHPKQPVLCSSFCRHLRLTPNYSPCFIYYLLQTLYRSGFMAVFNIQHTGVSRFQYTSFKKHTKLKIPNRTNQEKIAAILTAYDDLIETNKRRIALLEKMAEELYREWFVRMRFPGYQNTKFVKGVPEGWPLQRFTEVVFMNPRESVHKSDFVPYVGMDNLSVSSMYFETNEVRQGAAGSKFRNRDSLLPRITPCLENGKRGFVSCLEEDQIGIGSTEFIVIREKVLPAEYIYLLSCNASFRQHAELSMTGASGRQRVQHDCFSYFFVPTPPQAIRNKFSGIISPMFESVALLSQENVKLTQTRDLLLPRLISGKLSIEDLAIRFPPSMCEEAD